MGIHQNNIKPTMTVYNGIALVATMMIGSGIFIIPAIVVAKVGSIGMAILMWILVAVISLSGTNAFVELGMMFPKSGGALTYLAYAYKEPKYMLSFIFCITQILVIWPAMITSEVDASSRQLLYNAEPTEWSIKCASILTVSAIVFINYFSVEFAMKLSTALTYLKFYMLYAMIIAGVFAYCGIAAHPEQLSQKIVWFEGSSKNPSDYASAVFSLLWVYDGWNNLNYAIEEMKDPTKDFPRAVYSGVGITSILYNLANFFFITLVPYEKILGSKLSIASVYSEIIFGDFVGGKVMPFLIFLSCYGTTDNMVYGVSRIIHAASRAQILPFHAIFSKLDDKRGSPRNALLYTWAISVILILLPLDQNAFNFFVQMAMYPKWIFYGLAVVGLIILRWTDPFFKRPIKAYIACCVLIIIASIFLAIFPLLGADMIPSVVSLGVMFLSGILYFGMRKQILKADFGFMEDTASLSSNSDSSIKKQPDTIYTELDEEYKFVSP